MVLQRFLTPSGALGILRDRSSLSGTDESDGGNHIQKRKGKCQEAGKTWENEEGKGLRDREEVKWRWRKPGLKERDKYMKNVKRML